MLLTFQEAADHKDETRVGGRGNILGSWPDTQGSLPQEDRLVTNCPSLEHSERFPAFSLSSFHYNKSWRGERRGQWRDFALCAAYTFTRYLVTVMMGI